MIFMVGMGYFDHTGAWKFEVFTADQLVLTEERHSLEGWIPRMKAVCAETSHDFGARAVRIFHWSSAELSFIQTAYNSAAERHGLPAWRSLPWVDPLGRVVKEMPVTIRGAFGFGLKAITNALHAAGLNAKDWPDRVANGTGAMVGAWWCDGEARRTAGSMRHLDLMQAIERYNRVDVEAIRDVLGWLRRNR